MRKHKAWDIFGMIVMGLSSLVGLYLLICIILIHISRILNS